MSLYNLSALNYSSGPLVMVQAIDANSGSWFMGSILMFIWVIIFVRYRPSGAQDAFLGSSFIVSILAGLAFGFGAFPGTYLAIPVTVLVIAIIMKVWGEG